jgi:hypothetical protein
MYAKSFHRFEAHGDDEDSDRDRTLRALEGYTDSVRTYQNLHSTDQNEQRQSDAVTEDLFLNLARDDLDSQGNNGVNSNATERRRVSRNFQFFLRVIRLCFCSSVCNLASLYSRIPFLTSDRCARAPIPLVTPLINSSLGLHWQAIVSLCHSLISNLRVSQSLVAALISKAHH